MSIKKKENIIESNKKLEQRYFLTENKIINELSKNSTGVVGFLKTVKETPGLLKHLKFSKFKNLEDFIYDNDIDEFTELLDETEKFFKKKK